MEFLLRMQVPAGQPLAGMAHHKIHDVAWTPLPTQPQNDPQPRYLYPPSTAATLNLAAAGAQCARVWQRYDPPFARRCLAAAQAAWNAARQHPDVYAYDLTGEARYRTAALESMDYLLGRNAVNQSYVTGYGERASQNQHTRIWAHELDPSLPNPPPGSFAGGPNSFLQDPVAQRNLPGCAPAKCYLDEINSYSTNEVAVNWASSLAWMAAFAAQD
jgi:hypothetical protein